MLNADELDRLAAASTKEPWYIDEDRRKGGADQIVEINGDAVCFMTSDRYPDGDDSDAALIVYLRNYVPEISATLRENERLQEALKLSGITY